MLLSSVKWSGGLFTWWGNTLPVRSYKILKEIDLSLPVSLESSVSLERMKLVNLPGDLLSLSLMLIKPYFKLSLSFSWFFFLPLQSSDETVARQVLRLLSLWTRGENLSLTCFQPISVACTRQAGRVVKRRLSDSVSRRACAVSTPLARPNCARRLIQLKYRRVGSKSGGLSRACVFELSGEIGGRPGHLLIPLILTSSKIVSSAPLHSAAHKHSYFPLLMTNTVRFADEIAVIVIQMWKTKLVLNFWATPWTLTQFLSFIFYLFWIGMGENL